MSGPWENYSAPEPAGPWQKYGPPKVSVDQGLSQTFGGGAAMGFGDEATAGVRAFAPKFSNWMMNPGLKRDPSIGGSPEPQTVSTKPTFEGRYEDELARERAKRASFKESNPLLSEGGNIAGNVAGAAVTLPVANALAGGAILSRAASPIVNVLKAGGIGAGYGGLIGYGEGEGDNRLASAAIGAGMGGVLGGATVPAGALARAAIQSPVGQFVGQKIVAPALRAISPSAPKTLSAAAADGGGAPPSLINALASAAENPSQGGAIDRIATLVQRSGRSIESLERDVKRLGPEAVLADLDEALLRGTQGVKVLQGQTGSLAKNVLTARDKAQPRNMASAFEGDQPPLSAYELRGEGQQYDQNIKKVGATAYQGDMVNAGLKQSPEMRRLLDDPLVDNALKTIKASIKEARAMNPNIPEPSPVELMHLIKREIQGIGYDKATGRPLSTAHYWREASDHYVDTLKKANPALAEADKAYSQAKSLPEHFDAGRNFLAEGTSEKALNASAPALGNLLASANPQQVAATRAGSTNTVRDLMTGRGALNKVRTLASDIENGPAIQAKISELYGPEQAAKIMTAAERVGVFTKTSNALQKGSQTAEKFSDALDMGNAGFRVTDSSVTARFFEHLNAIKNWIVNPNTAVRDEIGRTMLSQDQLRNLETLAKAGDVLKRRATGNALRSAAPGIAGGQSGRE